MLNLRDQAVVTATHKGDNDNNNNSNKKSPLKPRRGRENLMSNLNCGSPNPTTPVRPPNLRIHDTDEHCGVIAKSPAFKLLKEKSSGSKGTTSGSKGTTSALTDEEWFAEEVLFLIDENAELSKRLKEMEDAAVELMMEGEGELETTVRTLTWQRNTLAYTLIGALGFGLLYWFTASSNDGNSS